MATVAVLEAGAPGGIFSPAMAITAASDIQSAGVSNLAGADFGRTNGTTTIVNNGVTQSNTTLGGTLAQGFVDLRNRNGLTAFVSNPALTLNLRSEASSRFEKGLSPEGALEAQAVATQREEGHQAVNRQPEAPPAQRPEVPAGAALHGVDGGQAEVDEHEDAGMRVPAQALVDAAHQVCPYSNATRGNVDVGLTVG